MIRLLMMATDPALATCHSTFHPRKPPHQLVLDAEQKTSAFHGLGVTIHVVNDSCASVPQSSMSIEITLLSCTCCAGWDVHCRFNGNKDTLC